ncbi:MAG: hypothetical protein KDB80_11645 [Planctomycetes bacterium]|nr:hypothetical protein [Planctomycetota bacterium]
MDHLRQRFPNASDSTLFCVFKLQSDSDLSLRDFRAEARLHGLEIGGRSLHTARVLLGLQEPNPTTPRIRRPARVDPTPSPASEELERSLIAAVQQIQSSATAESNRLRNAMRTAVDVLQRALDGRE